MVTAPVNEAIVRVSELRLSDVDDFIRHIQNEYGIKPENICVIAQSVGAVLVSTWLHDYAPKIRCAVLASPAFKVKLYVPFARTGLKIMQKWRGNFFVNSYVKAHYLTHNVERQKATTMIRLLPALFLCASCWVYMERPNASLPMRKPLLRLYNC